MTNKNKEKKISSDLIRLMKHELSDLLVQSIYFRVTNQPFRKEKKEKEKKQKKKKEILDVQLFAKMFSSQNL